MMVALSDDARTHLEQYLKQVRVALRGHASVDADEVERDLRSHVDAELSGQPEPIDAARLREKLARLGTPRTLAPSDDLPAWRRLLDRLRSGPEDWRLAYLTFALFIIGPTLFMAGPFVWPLELLLIVGSALMARASLALLAEHDEPVGARRWLIYPPLMAWYVVIVLALFVGPLPLLGNAVLEDTPVRARIAAAFSGRWSLVATSILVAAMGVWWAVVGLLLGLFPDAVRVGFWPFTDWFGRRHGMGVAIAGLLLALISGGVLACAEPSRPAESTRHVGPVAAQMLADRAADWRTVEVPGARIHVRRGSAADNDARAIGEAVTMVRQELLALLGGSTQATPL